MTTTGSANGMAIRDWAFLACRVLALCLFYLAIERSLPAILYTFFMQSGGEDAWLARYYYLVQCLLAVAGGLLLWFGAARLAGWMVQRRADETREAVTSARNFTRPLSLAVAVLGLVVLIFAIPEAAGLGARYFAEDRLYDPHLVEILVLATRLVLGLLLVFGGRGIANVIGRARGWQAS